VSKRKPAATIQSDLSRAELWFARLALFAAFAISAYLAWHSFQGGSVPGCGPESDCDRVLASRWSRLLGLPVSLFALPLYAGLLALLAPKSIRWKLVLPLAVTVLAAAVWFVGLQAFVLRAFCKFCMTAHAAGGLAALVLLRNSPLPARPTLAAIGTAVAAMAVVIGAQVTAKAPAPVSVAAAPSTQALPAATPLLPSDPTFTIVQGQFTLNLKNVPVSGLLTAPKKAAKLFDYTCHHCRDLHHLLKPIREKYPDDLAIVSLPMPLDPGCNPLIKRPMKSHENACEYAKLGLAVFLAKAEKFEAFSDWIFAPERPPGLAETRSHAESLVGKAALDAALASPRISEQIAQDVNIYTASSRLAKSGAMPQLLFTEGGSIGAVSTVAQLEKILSDNLRLGVVPVPPAAAAIPGTQAK